MNANKTEGLEYGKDLSDLPKVFNRSLSAEPDEAMDGGRFDQIDFGRIYGHPLGARDMNER